MHIELKFKIFDKNDTKHFMGPYAWNELPHMLYPENFDIVQSTGLKDIEGNEIYTGDIVRAWSMDGDYNKTLKNFVCEYQLENAWFVFESKDEGCYWLEIRGMEPTVIGNIYQNKELLQ